MRWPQFSGQRPEIRGPTLVVVPASGSISAAFAIGKFEVSLGDWNTYCRLSGQCDERADVIEENPATNILVDEARDLAAWLSERTNAVYRLPTSDEWGHAASASGERTSTDDNCSNRGRTPRNVRQGRANAWGLNNFVGNAQEWVSTPSGLEVRGGSYRDSLSSFCSLEMGKTHNGARDEVTGFRLVREISETA